MERNHKYIFHLQVGYFPSAVGAESLSTLLDESSLLRHCHAAARVGDARAGGETVVPMSEAVQSFRYQTREKGERSRQKDLFYKCRYFVIDNGTIAAVLEEPLGNDQEPQPTVRGH